MAEEPVNLESVKDASFSPSNQKPYDILNNVLQPGSRITPAEAARQINELFPVQSSEHADDSSHAERAENFLWNFWTLLIQSVQLVPHDHPGQTKLVLTVEELSRLPPTKIQLWGAETRVWTDLPLLGPCMRDAWISPTYDGNSPDGEKAQKWLNLNSFAARVLNKRLVKWTNFAIWGLRGALEEPSQSKPIMNHNLMTASEWILQGGEELFRQLSEDLAAEEDRSTQPGSLFTAKAGLRRERWNFWKKRFSEVSEQVDENVRERVRRAVEKMGKLEQMGGQQS